MNGSVASCRFFFSFLLCAFHRLAQRERPIRSSVWMEKQWQPLYREKSRKGKREKGGCVSPLTLTCGCRMFSLETNVVLSPSSHVWPILFPIRMTVHWFTRWSVGSILDIAVSCLYKNQSFMFLSLFFLKCGVVAISWHFFNASPSRLSCKAFWDCTSKNLLIRPAISLKTY